VLNPRNIHASDGEWNDEESATESSSAYTTSAEKGTGEKQCPSNLDADAEEDGQTFSKFITASMSFSLSESDSTTRRRLPWCRQEEGGGFEVEVVTVENLVKHTSAEGKAMLSGRIGDGKSSSPSHALTMLFGWLLHPNVDPSAFTCCSM
jgi:hypothetical protein